MPAWDGSPSHADLELIDFFGRVPSWHDQAACRNHPQPDWWFPPPGRQGLRLANNAKRVCGDCPVQVTCLGDAMSREEQHGIWGGMSRLDRRALRKKARHVA